MDSPLKREEIAAALIELPGWHYEDDALLRTLEFSTFRDAFAFMTRAAFEAEAMDHHPEWTNVYNEVRLRLTTHHAGDKVTAKDIELARRISRLASPS